MKQTRILILGLLVSGAAAFAGELDYEEAYIQEHKHLLDTPVPVETFRPILRNVPEDLRIDVLVTVDELGRVIDARIEDSNATRFNREVLSAVKRWRFRPAIREGEVVRSTVRIPFVNEDEAATVIARK